MSNYYPVEFTEENIQKLFGHEAAEDENIERLKEYYFKNKVYNKVASDLSLRILVGHKGLPRSTGIRCRSTWYSPAGQAISPASM